MTVPRRVLARCFCRGLFLQAAWNRRGMQNLGFAFAIEPALESLYPSSEERLRALSRHLGFFNCHPYVASAILGGAIHHEEQVAAGREPPVSPANFKTMLQGPLAAIGDGFFWTALRPACGALAAAGALVVGWPAVVIALLVYNVVHLALRIGLFKAGYRTGDGVVDAVARLSLPIAADRLRVVAAVLCGLCAAAFAAQSALPRTGAAGLVFVAAAGGWWLLGRGLRLLTTTYAAIMAGAGAALIVGWLSGGM